MDFFWQTDLKGKFIPPTRPCTSGVWDLAGPGNSSGLPKNVKGTFLINFWTKKTFPYEFSEILPVFYQYFTKIYQKTNVFSVCRRFADIMPAADTPKQSDVAYASGMPSWTSRRVVRSTLSLGWVVKFYQNFTRYEFRGLWSVNSNQDHYVC